MHLHKQIGPAVWLLLLLLRFVPADWSGDEPAWVVGGNVVSDSELAERLEVSRAVIAKWRLRLCKLGLVGWLVAPGQGRAFGVAGANRVLGSEEKRARQEAAKQIAQPPGNRWLTGAAANTPPTCPAAARTIELLEYSSG